MVSRAIEWFFVIPADMLATGEPNGHLIRDVGFAYIVFGFALNWCAMQLERRRAVFLMVSFFMVAHAFGHVIEILLGLLPTSHCQLNPYDRATFYGGDERGYTDYPALHSH